MSIKVSRESILKEMNKIKDSHHEFVRLESELELLKHKCDHENAYWTGNQTSDDYEGRVYDEIFCPDCGLVKEERCYCGNHKYPPKNNK